MKRIIPVVMALALLLGAGALYSAQTDSEGTGKGIGLVFGGGGINGITGDVGLSLKVRNFPVVGIYWLVGSGLGGTVDLWFINNNLGSNFWWYLGAGAYTWLRFDSTNWFSLGGRIPIGIQWLPGGGPFEIALEIAPALRIIPPLDFDAHASLALRYHY